MFTEGDRTFRIKDGQISIEGPGGQTETMQIREVIPSGAVDVVQALGATLVMIIVGFPLSRAFARWIDRRSSVPRVPRELTDRLQHMEQSLDQVAVEVERISEAQRFSAQLLAAEARQPETASRGSLP